MEVLDGDELGVFVAENGIGGVVSDHAGTDEAETNSGERFHLYKSRICSSRCLLIISCNLEA